MTCSETSAAEPDKRRRIIDGAIKVLGRKGYQYATVAEIAAEAGVSKGLVHVYFQSKLDILLEVILDFIESVNRLMDRYLARCATPVEQIHALFTAMMELMSQDNKNLYWSHILREVLPDAEKMKEDILREKYVRIIGSARRMQQRMDGFIADGQRQGLIDPSLKPQVIRQIIGGSSQMLYHGLVMESHGGRATGYGEEDVRAGITALINKFVIQKP